MQLVADRRASLALACGVLLGIVAVTVYVMGVRATPASDQSISVPHPAILTGFGIGSVLWLIGTGLVAFALGRMRKQRKKSMRWSVLLFGAAPVTFVGTLALAYSPVPFVFSLVVGLITLALFISGIVLAVLSGQGDR